MKLQIKRHAKQEIIKSDSIANKSGRVFSYLKWYHFVLIGIPLCVLFVSVLFPADLWHTSMSSLTYLQGHILDFYDVNKVKMNGDDYYPLIYIIFAIWNIPLKLINISTFTQSTFAIMFYEKFLPCLFLVASAIPFFKIIRKSGADVKQSVFASLLYLTSPVIIISTFGWGMYDSLYILFMICGLFYFLREEKKYDMVVAMLLFGLAFSIKLICVFAIIPIIIYRYKNIFKLAGFTLLSLSPVLIQRLFYIASPAFANQAADSSDFVGRLFWVSIDTGGLKYSVFFLAFAGLCLLAYHTDYEEKNIVKPIYFGLLGSTVFFTLVLWHPQWMAMVIPFLAITMVLSSKRNKYMLYDFAFVASYLMFVFSFWDYFCENAFVNSVFGHMLLHKATLLTRAVLIQKLQPVFLAFVIAILIVNCIIRNPWKFGDQYSKNSITAEKQDYIYLYLRFYLSIGFFAGPIVIFVIRSLLIK